MGLPLNADAVPDALDVVLGDGGTTDVTRILLDKFRQLHPSLVPDVVGRLVAKDGALQAATQLLAHLPQVALFEALVQDRGLGDWGPGRGFKSAEAARRRSQMSKQALELLRLEPTVDLVRFVLGRSGEEEEFARRFGPFLKEILKSVDGREGAVVVKHFERLTSGASEEKVARLAQLLVELSARLEGGPGHQAALLLEEWKDRSAALRLKIYHLQQGLGWAARPCGATCEPSQVRQPRLRRRPGCRAMPR